MARITTFAENGECQVCETIEFKKNAIWMKILGYPPTDSVGDNGDEVKLESEYILQRLIEIHPQVLPWHELSDNPRESEVAVCVVIGDTKVRPRIRQSSSPAANGETQSSHTGWPQMMHASTVGRERRDSEQIPFSSASSRSRAVGLGSNPSTGRSMTLPSCSTAATADSTGHGFGFLCC